VEAREDKRTRREDSYRPPSGKYQKDLRKYSKQKMEATSLER
jgi:hypothetical protein